MALSLALRLKGALYSVMEAKMPYRNVPRKIKIAVYITPTEHRDVALAARSSELTLSEFVRKLIIVATGTPKAPKAAKAPWIFDSPDDD